VVFSYFRDVLDIIASILRDMAFGVGSQERCRFLISLVAYMSLATCL